MSKTQFVNGILIGNIIGEVSDHKILVSNYDTNPDFLLNKISKNSVIKLVEDDESGKFKFLVNTQDGSSSGGDKGNLYRCISTFSTQQIDIEYTKIHSNEYKCDLIVFPITIPLGEIRSFAIYCTNSQDILNIDKIELAIVSNTINNIAGSKVEFAVEYYGYNNPNNTCKEGTDFKTFIVNTDEDKELNPNIKVTNYKGLFDTTMNYHYIVALIHSSSSTSTLLGKSTSQNKLVEVGKNMNYCGRWENKESIYLDDGIIDKNTMTISNDCGIQTNMGSSIPYIEFYQLRNLSLE